MQRSHIVSLLFHGAYGVIDDFPDYLSIYNYAASSIAFVMLASFVSISVHSLFVVAVVMSYR